MPDARKRLVFDIGPAQRYQEREKQKKEQKQMDKLRPSRMAVEVSNAAHIAGVNYTKGVRNGKN